jgi:adenine C2-methylase RlmN of 23S rRNA A2503 and tRNA A37
MKVKLQKDFKNGSVYCLELEDGKLIEVTDTFLPYYTKNCTMGDNRVKDGDLGDRTGRWMIGVSTQSGCPVGCKFCATGTMSGWRNLSAKEIIEQVQFIVRQNMVGERRPIPQEFKINYTRMGEPFLNIDAVQQAISVINYTSPAGVHHYVSTVGIKGSDFRWIKDNITLQVSLHSLDEDRRRELIPINNLMSIEELGQIRTKSNLKTTVNLSLVDNADFDIEKLKKYFDPDYFFIKLSPINPNAVSEANGMGVGIIEGAN